MLNISLTVTAGAKDPLVYEWPDVTKLQIMDAEEQLLNGLLKLNAFGWAIAEGRMPKGTTTAPVEMTIEFLIEEDGEKWQRTTLEYPKMGEEQQAMFLGMLAGQLAGLGRDMRKKTQSGKAKKAPK